MIEFLLLALTTPEPPEEVPVGCERDAPIRDPKVCEPLYDDGTYTIYNMESVAVGSIAEMHHVRQQTRDCKVTNRIDHLGGVDIGIFDIFNANEESRACVIGWIKENVPELEFSEERFAERFREAPPLDKQKRQTDD